MVSKRFVAAVKLSPLKSYEISLLAGLHHTTLSKLVNGIERVKLGDQRVIRVGRVLGLSPEECFELGDTADNLELLADINEAR